MKRIAALILLASLSANALAFDAVRRLGHPHRRPHPHLPGTVYSYLPVEKGDRLTDDEAQAGDSCAVQDQILQRRGT